MSKKPQIQNITELAKSRIFTIEGLDMRFSNGEERQYERVHGKAKEAVLVLPCLDEDTILLIREYAAGIDDYVLTFPKGAVDPGEDVLDCANRELMEEIGYQAADLQLIKTVTTSPGYMTTSMHLILARGLSPKRLQGDEPEELEVIPWALADYRELLARDDFNEGRSMAALLWLVDQVCR